MSCKLSGKMLNKCSLAQKPLPCPPTSARLPRPRISPASCCKACRTCTLSSPPSGLGLEHGGISWALASSLRLPGLLAKLQRETDTWAPEGMWSNLPIPARGRGRRGAEPLPAPPPQPFSPRQFIVFLITQVIWGEVGVLLWLHSLQCYLDFLQKPCVKVNIT